MRINDISNTGSLSFQTRIRINKQGVANIAKDLMDTASSGSRCVGTGLSTTGEVTMCPSDLIAGIGLSKTIEKQAQEMEKHINNIGGRNIKSLYTDNEAELKLAEQASSVVSSGSGLMTTGVGSYASAGASVIDQSIYTPCLGSESVPRFIESLGNKEISQTVDAAQKYAYSSLQKSNSHESAAGIASLPSVGGFISQGMGSEMIARPKKVLKGGTKNSSAKKIPS